MATRSSGGVSGLVYGLVLFVFLFMVCLALAILFYTRYAKAEQERAAAVATNDALIDTIEQNGAEFNRLSETAREARRSVFGQQLVEAQALKSKMVGSSDKTLDQIVADFKAINVPADQPLLAALKDCRSKAQGLEQQVANYAAADQERTNQLTNLREQYRALESAHQTEIAQRKAEIQQLRDRLEQFEQQGQAQLTDLKGQWQADRQQSQQQKRDMEQQMSDLRTEIAIRERRIRELEKMIEDFRLTGPNVLLESDGSVVSVVPTENVVYINIGKQDRVMLGMPFEVYDEESGVVVDRLGTEGPIRVRGKATLEVVRVSENTAGCRVVRLSRGAVIQSGDLITNIAYDKSRTLKFFVYGDYDLDYDGQSSLADYDQVVAMIREWGGVVAEGDTMPLDVDFLVLGASPDMPRALGPTATPEEIRRYQQRLKTFREYQNLGATAADLKIPLLNQNRLLTLIGYYTR